MSQYQDKCLVCAFCKVAFRDHDAVIATGDRIIHVRCLGLEPKPCETDERDNDA